MEQIGAFIGALVATYGVSRITLRLLAARAPLLTRMPRLLAAHGVSLLVLMLIAGFTKNYFNAFALDRASIFIAPQIMWVVIDWLRGKADR